MVVGLLILIGGLTRSFVRFLLTRYFLTFSQSTWKSVRPSFPLPLVYQRGMGTTGGFTDL